MFANFHALILILALLFGLIFLFFQTKLALNSLNTLKRDVTIIRSQLASGNLKDVPNWLRPILATSRHSLFLTAARDICKQSIDELLDSQKHILMLRKSLTASPLVGVVLTAIGFGTIELQIENLRSLTLPLVGGVAIGALLAIVNQVLLFVVERRLDDTRIEAQTLLDDTWTRFAQQVGDPHEVTVTAINKLQIVTESLQLALGDFPRNLSLLTKKFDSIYESSQQVLAVLNSLSAQLTTAIGEWKYSSNMLKESVEKDLCPSLTAISNMINSINSSASSLDSAANSIDEVVRRYHDTSAAHLELQDRSIEATKFAIESQKQAFVEQLKDFRNVQDHSLSIAQTNLEELISKLSNTIEPHLSRISSGTESIATPLRETASFLSNVTPGLKDSANLLAQITDFATDFKLVVVGQLAPALQSMLVLKDNSAHLEQSLNRLSSMLSEIEKACHAGLIFSDLLQKRALPTVEVLQRATGSFEDSANILAECTIQLGDSVKMLNQRMVAVQPKPQAK